MQEPTMKSFELGGPKKGLSKREQEEIKKKVNTYLDFRCCLILNISYFLDIEWLILSKK